MGAVIMVLPILWDNAVRYLAIETMAAKEKIVLKTRLLLNGAEVLAGAIIFLEH